MATIEQILKNIIASRPDLAVELTPEERSAQAASDAEYSRKSAEDDAALVAAAAPNHYPLYIADVMARGTGSKYAHAHNHDARGECHTPALCGTKPGKITFWGHYFAPAVTCPRCLRKLDGAK